MSMNTQSISVPVGSSARKSFKRLQFSKREEKAERFSAQMEHCKLEVTKIGNRYYCYAETENRFYYPTELFFNDLTSCEVWFIAGMVANRFGF